VIAPERLHAIARIESMLLQISAGRAERNAALLLIFRRARSPLV